MEPSCHLRRELGKDCRASLTLSPLQSPIAAVVANGRKAKEWLQVSDAKDGRWALA